MISSEVQADPREARPDPEVMSFGPSPGGREHRRALLVAFLVGLLLLAGFGAWRLLPKPAPDFTRSDLQGVYVGMVRNDGTNDMSTVTRDKLTGRPANVRPDTCAPLFEATLSNQFPATALDGVSTYWLNVGSASISLFTYRYPDATAATAQFEQVRAALRSCVGVPLTVDRSGVSVVEQPVTPLAKVKNYLSYVVTSPPATTRFTTDLVQLNNTVTWQYRYDYNSQATYSPVPARQLMGSMIAMMQYVQKSHR
jgi:hypothetical protein